MSKLILMIGIPGCGKSTWATRYAQEHPGVSVVSSDGIRRELSGTEEFDPDPAVNMRVFAMVRSRVSSRILLGDVIVDATNVHVRDWRQYIELCPGGTDCRAVLFDVGPDEAMRRQEGRERKVPREVLDRMWGTIGSNRGRIPEFFGRWLVIGEDGIVSEMKREQEIEDEEARRDTGRDRGAEEGALGEGAEEG